MKNQFIKHLLLFVFAVPLFFSCSTTKEYYSFGPATGKFHGAKAEKSKLPEEPVISEIKSIEQGQVLAETPADLHLAASSDQTPDENLLTTVAKLKAAEAEAAEMSKAKTAKLEKTKTKLNLVQKLALKKMQKMLKKTSENTQVETAKEKPGLLNKLMLDQNLKLALIFLIVSLIGYIFSWILGTILFIVALVFLILWISTL